MTFSEQELHDIVDMVQKGTDIEIAKEKATELQLEMAGLLEKANLI